MIGVLLSIAALFVTYWLAKQSLVKGILSALTWGYAFGILRANFPETASYFIFDAAVLGLYCAQYKQFNRPQTSIDGQRLRHWVIFLIIWPLLLFFVPQQDPLVQLVGLRGNVFLLPFILIGANLETEEIYQIGIWLAILNIGALAIGTTEYVFGIEHFYPLNQATDLVYRSNDVGAGSAYRIPAVFSNAHSFGGMMVISLPWIAGAWVQHHRQAWHKNVLLAGVIAALLGVFMSAARSHFLELIVLITVFTFSARLRPIYRVGWLLILLMVGYIVATNERLQRFTTLNDTEYVSTRFQSSVNVTLIDAVTQYPFGLGLGGGGTSIPYFLADRVNRPIAVESELGRIHLETGLIGMVAWIGFVFWIFTRPRAHRGEPWFLGLRLAWFGCVAFSAIGIIGIGVLTAIPSSAVFLLSMGWIANHRAKTTDLLPLSPQRLDPRLLWAMRHRRAARS